MNTDGYYLFCVLNKHISTYGPVSVTPNTEPLHQLGTTAFAARHTDATTVHTPSTLVKAQTSCSLHLFQFNCLIPVLSDTIW